MLLVIGQCIFKALVNNGTFSTYFFALITIRYIP